MNDEEFLRALEACTLEPEQFDHRGHLRAGYLVLGREKSFARALERMAGLIRGFAEHHGRAGMYHETITVAWIAAIHERMTGSTQDGWEDFAARHPELFERGFLGRHYRPETLASARAREVFVLERLSA